MPISNNKGHFNLNKLKNNYIMHYLDQEHLENNILEIVVYKHTTDIPDEFYYELSSIQNCKYFDPKLLFKLLDNDQEYFLNEQLFIDMVPEEWYLVQVIQTKNDGIEFVSATNVTLTNNKFHRLH